MKNIVFIVIIIIYSIITTIIIHKCHLQEKQIHYLPVNVHFSIKYIIKNVFWIPKSRDGKINKKTS